MIIALDAEKASKNKLTLIHNKKSQKNKNRR